MPPFTATRCVRCGSAALKRDGAYLDCAGCGAAYPVLSGVPVMFRDVEVSRAPMIGEPAALALLKAFDAPADPLHVLRMRHISGVRARFGDAQLDTESAQFIDRVRASGHDIPDDPAPDEPDPEAVRAGSTGMAEPDEAARYRWVRDYIPRTLPPGRDLMANIRLHNAGRVTMPHAGRHPMRLAASWHDESGTRMDGPDIRTALPLDLAPGRQMTTTIRLRTPAAPGRYGLRLVVVHEGVGWLDADARTLSIRVAPGADTIDPPAGWSLRAERPESYDADHARASAMLDDWVRLHAPSFPRILEIGGNVSPLIATCPGELYNVDIDLMGLQVGHMLRTARNTEIAFLCADAEELPFAPGAFDAIVIVASLHHFPDPARLLARLRPLLRPQGFIGLFCEPVGHIWPEKLDPDFRAELEKGVNEQSFGAAEYAQIFREARLHVREAVIDFNSLKARLTALPAQAALEAPRALHDALPVPA